MGIIVNTNMAAIKSQRNLNSATSGLNKALERMSTGSKINRAADDAANLYVATGLETQIRGSKVAQNNIATGKNVLAIMEGDMDVILDNLNRIRDLSVQAANSIYSDDSIGAIKDEVTQRLAEIDRISAQSNFNGLTLLDGNSKLADIGLRLQVGANAEASANSILIEKDFFQPLNSGTLGIDATRTLPAGSDLDAGGSLLENLDKAYLNASNSAQYIDFLDTAINDIANKKAKIGATENRLESAAASLVTTIENNTNAKSTIMDADIAEESANYTKYQILQQTTSALLVQANSFPQIAINLVQGG